MPDGLEEIIYKARWVDGIKDLGMSSDAAIAQAIRDAGFVLDVKS